MEDPIKLSDSLFERLTKDSDCLEGDRSVPIEEESPELRSFVKDLDDPAYIDRQLAELNSFDVDAAWRAVCGRACGRAKRPVSRVNRLTGVWLKWVSVAAMIAILIGIGIYMYRPSSEIIAPEISEEIAEAIEKSEENGLSGAIIEKKNYSVRHIVHHANDKGDKGVSGNKAEQRSHDSVVAEMLSATNITTYYDKEFWLTLPDGTLVHLGRNTRMIYPDKFDKDVRDVYLEGEAYFIVAKSTDRRFVVHTATSTATVYGTEFNVSAIADKACSVVLVKGSVGVSTLGGKEAMLKPGEEAVMNDGNITVSEVDVTPYLAWNTGRVDFTGWNLGKVMAVIGKWYGKKVRFSEDSFSTVEISGSFNRYETLGPTLEALSIITGLDIRSDSENIYINKLP